MFSLIFVDDEDIVREGIAKRIPWEQNGFRLSGVFSNSRDALDHIRKNKVDVVLSDISMPRMDGLTLSRIIAEQYPSIHVLLLTGFDEFEYAQKAIRYHVKDFLLKPITAAELGEVLERTRRELNRRSAESLPVQLPNNDSSAQNELHRQIRFLSRELRTGTAETVQLAARNIFTELEQIPQPDIPVFTEKIQHCLENFIQETGLEIPIGEFNLLSFNNLDEFQSYLTGLIHEIEKTAEHRRNNGIRIDKALDIITQRFTDKSFSLTDICSELSLSTSQFCTLFKEGTGQTFVEYLTGIRIDEARKLLKTTCMRSYEIADSVGYQDPRYFSSLFKKITGCTTIEYRRNLEL